MSKQTHVDLILPCYNPRAGWVERVVNSVNIIKGKSNIHLSIILVNDGSTEGITKEYIGILEKELENFRCIWYPANKGKGYALRTGVRESKNEICIYTDIDFPYTEESFVAVAEALVNDNADVVAGQRDEQYYRHVPLVRMIISRVLKALVKSLLTTKITDTQCGLKGFTAKGREVFLSTMINRYLFDLEFLYCAARQKLRIQPVTVQLKENVFFSTMNIRILITETFNFIKILLRRKC